MNQRRPNVRSAESSSSVCLRTSPAAAAIVPIRHSFARAPDHDHIFDGVECFFSISKVAGGLLSNDDWNNNCESVGGAFFPGAPSSTSHGRKQPSFSVFHPACSFHSSHSACFCVVLFPGHDAGGDGDGAAGTISDDHHNSRLPSALLSLSTSFMHPSPLPPSLPLPSYLCRSSSRRHREWLDGWVVVVVTRNSKTQTEHLVSPTTTTTGTRFGLWRQSTMWILPIEVNGARAASIYDIECQYPARVGCSLSGKQVVRARASISLIVLPPGIYIYRNPAGHLLFDRAKNV